MLKCWEGTQLNRSTMKCVLVEALKESDMIKCLLNLQFIEPTDLENLSAQSSVQPECDNDRQIMPASSYAQNDEGAANTKRVKMNELFEQKPDVPPKPMRDHHSHLKSQACSFASTVPNTDFGKTTVATSSTISYLGGGSAINSLHSYKDSTNYGTSNQPRSATWYPDVHKSATVSTEPLATLPKGVGAYPDPTGNDKDITSRLTNVTQTTAPVTHTAPASTSANTKGFFSWVPKISFWKSGTKASQSSPQNAKRPTSSTVYNPKPQSTSTKRDLEYAPPKEFKAYTPYFETPF